MPKPDRDYRMHEGEKRHYRKLWLDLVMAGDPEKEPEARRYAQMAGVSSAEIDHSHAVHFKPKSAQPVPAAQPPAEQPVNTSGHPLDDRRNCSGSFKGPCKDR